MREVRKDKPPQPRYGSTSQVGPWNSVLDQLKALTQEMRNFTGECVQQRGRGTRTPVSPLKKCWTCRGDHLQIVLIKSRKGEIADETGMTTFGILGVTPAREAESTWSQSGESRREEQSVCKRCT